MTNPTATSFRLLVPGLVLIAVAEALVLSLKLTGTDTRGFTWLVAALVAGFSLSGSV
ncbi:hypothetical protein [Nonomuraea sediminis]|uniref:hypothetical protein n=1 Tax=Nonomuraea sediminis TaxID=2835864 RepID=UPI001BDD5AD3|nr:hypothetical protein [Nonomuraea sediminis]